MGQIFFFFGRRGTCPLAHWIGTLDWHIGKGQARRGNAACAAAAAASASASASSAAAVGKRAAKRPRPRPCDMHVLAGRGHDGMASTWPMFVSSEHDGSSMDVSRW